MHLLIMRLKIVSTVSQYLPVSASSLSFSLLLFLPLSLQLFLPVVSICLSLIISFDLFISHSLTLEIANCFCIFIAVSPFHLLSIPPHISLSLSISVVHATSFPHPFSHFFIFNPSPSHTMCFILSQFLSELSQNPFTSVYVSCRACAIHSVWF